MKKLLILLLLHGFWATAQNNEWHVKPYGLNDYTFTSSAGGTSLANAWTLREALENTYNLIKPGDVVWLHQGTYKGHFKCTLNGDALNDKYIKVASYPGGGRAVIDGNIFDNSDGYTIPSGMDLVHILSVKGGHVHFENFEITCLGAFTRLQDAVCPPAIPFHEITGIDHLPLTVSKCKFVNLLIRNLPGVAMGSWKATADSEIYGCLMYYNGTILSSRTNCDPLSTQNCEGFSHCVYTQNDTDKVRVFRNNIFMNNYATGIAVWSQSGQGDFLRNYEISENVFLNNGSPVLDETPGLEVMSGGSSNIRPRNITIKDNLMYINSWCCQNAGPIIKKSDDVEMFGNYIFNGTNGLVTDASSKRFKFHHNTYTGKHIIATLQPSDYNSVGNEWSMHHNDYYIRTLVPDGKMFDTPAGGASNMTLGEFSAAYSSGSNIAEENSTYNCFAINPINDCVNMGYKFWIRQNRYNPNLFYVSIYNPPGTNAVVDFGNYTIPNNVNFTVRDAENYFTLLAVPGGNVYNSANHTITFPMNLTAIETIMPEHTGPYGPTYTPNGTDPTDGRPPHSKTEFRNFIVEFPCKIPFDLDVNNVSHNAYQLLEAQNNITFGPAYLASPPAVVDAKAGRQVRLLPGTTILPGTQFHAWIEPYVCPQISNLLPLARQSDINDNHKKPEAASVFTVYPNPTDGMFNIQSESAKINCVVVRNVMGSSIFENREIGKSETSVDISQKPDGLYFVVVTFEDGHTESKTIVKQ